MTECPNCGFVIEDDYDDGEHDYMTPAEYRKFQREAHAEMMEGRRKCPYCGRKLWEGNQRKERKCKCGAVGYRERKGLRRIFTTPSPVGGVKEGEALPPTMHGLLQYNYDCDGNLSGIQKVGETPD